MIRKKEDRVLTGRQAWELRSCELVFASVEGSVPVWSKYSNAHPYERNHQHGPPPISLKLAQIPCHGFQTRIASESSLLLTEAIHEVGACRLTAF